LENLYHSVIENLLHKQEVQPKKPKEEEASGQPKPKPNKKPKPEPILDEEAGKFSFFSVSCNFSVPCVSTHRFHDSNPHENFHLS
jgi:hypothetical protein